MGGTGGSGDGVDEVDDGENWKDDCSDSDKEDDCGRGGEDGGSDSVWR